MQLDRPEACQQRYLSLQFSTIIMLSAASKLICFPTMVSAFYERHTKAFGQVGVAIGLKLAYNPAANHGHEADSNHMFP